ncbi:MAG: radical SAM protein [Desulfurococcales archaeon]|nr:radical SAM protein [Desulfurococcales archaeon]
MKLPMIRGLKIIREFDPWRSKLCTCPHKFTLNPYTGCAHGCLYCYARSYIKDFTRVRLKDKLLQRVLSDLNRIPKGALISMSESSDPYTPPEHRIGVTRKVIQAILSKGFRLLIVTKSDLVVRDEDLLSSGNAAVSITITTINDELARRLEPGAPPPSRRIDAVKKLTSAGVPVTVRIDPIIPFLNDSSEDLSELVEEVANAGALQVTTSTYKARWDSLRRLSTAFPAIKDKLYDAYVERGVRVGGYFYLPPEVRLRYLLIVLPHN